MNDARRTICMAAPGRALRLALCFFYHPKWFIQKFICVASDFRAGVVDAVSWHIRLLARAKTNRNGVKTSLASHAHVCVLNVPSQHAIQRFSCGFINEIMSESRRRQIYKAQRDLAFCDTVWNSHRLATATLLYQMLTVCYFACIAPAYLIVCLYCFW